ncbi:class I SAM-dependent methyltransferase [Histidinibacterium lentulum]|uniref:Class I SAM-dependent methyltransferase n=1 Tax=Histidinibacterium lentulum TaxID=2480588 RepID=A0A3N2R8W4_9RHOB|nr:class I SAM-dependent methyltransferase [Histidinibacterium lentulum]ROU03867.1 class I SAM-dependent methyltransferase [Histidinibacterium lentulum]
MSGGQKHWDGVYGARSEDELTWFEATPGLSLELVREHLQPGEPFIDIGAGASRLVDVLLDEGFGPLTVLDLSGAALAVSRQRLGARGDDVAWTEADITTWEPERAYAVWHDRAVFHFLTAVDDRAGYARALSDALRPGGIAIIATFADDGPEMCSGLPVVRYAPEALAQELDRLLPGQFDMIDARRHLHITPKGNRQSFQYSVFRKTDH